MRVVGVVSSVPVVASVVEEAVVEPEDVDGGASVALSLDPTPHPLPDSTVMATVANIAATNRPMPRLRAPSGPRPGSRRCRVRRSGRDELEELTARHRVP